MFLLFSNWIVNIRDTDGQRSSHNAGDLWGGFVLYQVLRSSFTGGGRPRAAHHKYQRATCHRYQRMVFSSHGGCEKTCAIEAAPYLGLIPPRTPRPATLTLPTREPDFKWEKRNSTLFGKCYKII